MDVGLAAARLTFEGATDPAAARKLAKSLLKVKSTCSRLCYIASSNCLHFLMGELAVSYCVQQAHNRNNLVLWACYARLELQTDVESARKV